MAELLRMPAVLAGATEAVLLTWHVQAGEDFAEGAALADIETDKALVELTAEAAGTLGRALVLDGQTVTVGDPIAVLVAAGDSEADIDAAAADVTQPVTEQPVDGQAQPVPPPAAAASSPAPPPVSAGRMFVSPLVRRLAREQSIDLTEVPGTGPDGRIVRRDLEAWMARPPAPDHAAPAAPASPPTHRGAGHTDIPHTGMRRAIARRLTESKTTVPHFYLTAELHVDALLALRRQLNATPNLHVSVNDLLVKAIATAFMRVPAANVIWTDTALRQFDHVDIAVAVSTDGGLLTPVVRDVASQSLSALSASISDLVDRARIGRLHQHELEGGTCAISNLGMYGTREFSAILNPPHSGILAVGAIRDAVVVQDGQSAVAQVMTVTMSVDHRAIDGALAAQWLAEFTDVVENPVSMLV